MTPLQRAERAMKTPRHYYVGKRKTNVRRVVMLNTVNVIEVLNGTVQGVRSFTDNPTGNKRAERIFKRCVKENAGGTTFTRDVFSDMLDEGNWEDDNGYQIFLTHSI